MFVKYFLRSKFGRKMGNGNSEISLPLNLHFTVSKVNSKALSAGNYPPGLFAV